MRDRLASPAPRSITIACLLLLPVLPWIGADAQTLRIAIHGDIRGFNPGVTRDGDTDTVHHHLFESLVAYDGDLKVRPMLAEKVNVSADGLRYQFPLREGARFHNGEAVTADDVVWSWHRMLDPDTGWRCRAWYDGSTSQGTEITSVTADGPRTVSIEIARPSAVFLDRMANAQCFTAILHRDSVGPDGEFRRPIGTGPYRLVEWRRGEFVELRRFEAYEPRDEPMSGFAGGKLALTDSVRFVIIPDAPIAEAALLSGDIDILPRVPLQVVAELERSPEIVTVSADLLYWNVLLLQTGDPVLRDPRLRQAISHAINIDQVAAIATFDRAGGNPSAVPVISRFYSDVHRQRLPYDPERARRLLAAAGYDGQVLKLQTNRKFPFMFDAAIAVQAMLTAVGMNVELVVLDWATQLANYFDGEFQMMAFGYSGRTHPVLNYGTFLGDKSTNSAYQWQNKQALQLLSQAIRQSDEGEQSKLYERMHELMIRQAPIIGLYNEYEVAAVRRNIVGYSPWAVGRPRLWNVRKREGKR